MSFEPRFYLRIFRSRFPLFLLAFVVCVVAGFVAAVTLPTVYRAQAVLLVEESQIPSDLASSTVRVDLDQQLQVIQKRLLARGNLLELADKLELYADEPNLQPTDIVNRLRDRIELQLSGGGRAVTLLFIYAKAGDGPTATRMVNELMTQVLRQDASYRTEVATDTLSFFEKEVRRLGDELDYFNRRILEFQNNNLDSLPETFDYRLSRQSLLQERLSQTRREISQLSDQRRRLVELFETTGRTDSVLQRPLTPEEQELAGLRADLRRSLSIFSESNPKVAVLRARIEQLEEVVAGFTPDADAEEVPGEKVFRSQLVEIDSQIETLEAVSTQIEADIEALQETIERTPANAIALNTLQRDRENVQIQYNSAVERLSTAATGERIEVLSKGQRLSVVENAVVPTKPVNPPPALVLAASIAMGIVLGLAAVVAAEFLNPRVRRPQDITKGLGITPLATLPYMATPGQIWRQRGLRVTMFAMMLIGAGGALYLVNEMVMPLEQIAQKILQQRDL